MVMTNKTKANPGLPAEAAAERARTAAAEETAQILRHSA